VLKLDIYALLDELQTIARNGLHYTADVYDRERYERLLDISTQAYAELLEAPEKLVRERFLSELGYITPKVGANAAIFTASGKILLMERSDGSGWCLPCGFVDPCEKPSDAAKREAREETGLEIEVGQLVGVFTCLPSADTGSHTTVAIVHLCEVCSGELTLSHEGLDLRYWPIDAVPKWHADHERFARAAYAAWRSEILLPAISD
jgi:ADP-ribose pyrophosphatase YjhB (NUDIX family)